MRERKVPKLALFLFQIPEECCFCKKQTKTKKTKNKKQKTKNKIKVWQRNSLCNKNEGV